MVRIVVPSWTYAERTLSSIDIHPDGSRFVCGVNGTSGSSAKVTFWSMDPVRDAKVAASSQHPKILCEKDVPHTSINAVRWSSAGHLLASAEDEHVVIWCYSKSIESSFGSKVANVESWKYLHVMRGHNGNVFDVRWGPNDRFLASCSVDNKIIIWNAKNFPEMYKTLSGHTNFVKGLCWDPLGNFLASQSDDRTLRIWRTSDWGEEMKIWKPFARHHNMTHYLRCDWSPDAQYVVSTHAVNQEGPVAVICNRADKFSVKNDFVGHRKPVTCVRFHSRMIRIPKTGHLCCLLAIASKDRSVSFWLTGMSRAFLVYRELLDDEIVDISWAKDRFEFAACSLRGKIAFVLFSFSEIGQFISEEQQKQLLKKLFGEQMNVNIPAVVVQDPDLFPYLVTNGSTSSDKENVTSPPMPKSAQKRHNKSMAPQQATVSTTQIEIRSKDGKRRITPVCLNSLEQDTDEDEVVVPRPFRGIQSVINQQPSSARTPEGKGQNEFSSNAVSSTTSPGSPSTVVNTPMECDSPIVEVDINSLQLTTFASYQKSGKTDLKQISTTLPDDSAVSQKNDPINNRVVIQSHENQNVISRVSNENIAVSPDSSTVVTEKVPNQEVSTSDVNAVQSVPVVSADAGLELDKSKGQTVIDKSGKQSKKNKLANAKNSSEHRSLFQSQGMTAAKKRKRVVVFDDDDEDGALEGQAEGSEKLPKKGWKYYQSNNFIDDEYTEDEEESESGRNENERYSPVEVLDACSIRSTFTVTEHGFTLNVSNNVDLGHSAPLLHRVEYRKAGTDAPSFSMTFTSPVVAVTCSSRLLVMACADCTIHVHDHSGNLLMLPFITDAKIAKLCCEKEVVMAITCEVTVSVWDMAKRSSLLVNYQLTSLFQSSSVHLKAAYLTNSGQPIVVTTELKAYSFNSDFQTWVLIHEPKWSFARSVSLHSDSGLMKEVADLCSDGARDCSLLNAVNKARNFDPSAVAEAEKVTQEMNWKHCQMEEQFALSLGLASEFKKWFLKCVTELGYLGYEEALRKKLDDLVGNVTPELRDESPSEPDYISRLGLNKTELLRETLAIIAKNVTTQKIFSEYNQILKHI